MVGRRLEWRDGEICEAGRQVSDRVYLGEYNRTDLSEGRKEYTSFWTGERWILEENEYWMGGPYFHRGNLAFSASDPQLKIELSAKAVENWRQLWMLVGRPIYYDGEALRDAITDNVLFTTELFRVCSAGCLIEVGGELQFTDGVRENLPICKVRYEELARVLRVSETVYSVQVEMPETGYRYFLLDTARWTAIRI